MRNDDIHLMIKMENVIGMNLKAIFGEDHSKSVTVDGLEITYYDFIDYINLVDRVLNNKKTLSARANAYNKAHPDKHRKHSRDYARRKKQKINKSKKEL